MCWYCCTRSVCCCKSWGSMVCRGGLVWVVLLLAWLAAALGSLNACFSSCACAIYCFIFCNLANIVCCWISTCWGLKVCGNWACEICCGWSELCIAGVVCRGVVCNGVVCKGIVWVVSGVVWIVVGKGFVWRRDDCSVVVCKGSWIGVVCKGIVIGVVCSVVWMGRVWADVVAGM